MAAMICTRSVISNGAAWVIAVPCCAPDALEHVPDHRRLGRIGKAAISVGAGDGGKTAVQGGGAERASPEREVAGDFVGRTGQGAAPGLEVLQVPLVSPARIGRAGRVHVLGHQIISSLAIGWRAVDSVMARLR